MLWFFSINFITTVRGGGGVVGYFVTGAVTPVKTQFLKVWRIENQVLRIKVQVPVNLLLRDTVAGRNPQCLVAALN